MLRSITLLSTYGGVLPHLGMAFSDLSFQPLRLGFPPTFIELSASKSRELYLLFAKKRRSPLYVSDAWVVAVAQTTSGISWSESFNDEALTRFSRLRSYYPTQDLYTDKERACKDFLQTRGSPSDIADKLRSFEVGSPSLLQICERPSPFVLDRCLNRRA